MRHKTELFGHNVRRYVSRSKGETFKPKNTVPAVMVVVASCSGAVLLPVALVHYTKWMEY